MGSCLSTDTLQLPSWYQILTVLREICLPCSNLMTIPCTVVQAFVQLLPLMPFFIGNQMSRTTVSRVYITNITMDLMGLLAVLVSFVWRFKACHSSAVLQENRKKVSRGIWSPGHDSVRTCESSHKKKSILVIASWWGRDSNSNLSLEQGAIRGIGIWWASYKTYITYP